MKRIALLALPLLVFITAVHAQSGPPLDPNAIPATVASAEAGYEAMQGYAYVGDCSQVDASAAGDSCSLTWLQADGTYLANFFTVQADGTAPGPAFDSTVVPGIETPLPPAPAPAPVTQPDPAPAPTSAHTWYTSSASNGTTYYCDDDPDWRSLSPRNLQSYPTVAALLAVYPIKHLHRPCLDGATGP